jgi:hypothetical protein
MKHLKHKSETPETIETQRRRRPQPTWWETPITSQLGLGGRREQRPSVHPWCSAQASPPVDRRARWGCRRRPPLPLLMWRVRGMRAWHRAVQDVAGRGGVEEGGWECGRAWSWSEVMDSRRYDDIFLTNCGAWRGADIGEDKKASWASRPLTGPSVRRMFWTGH